MISVSNSKRSICFILALLLAISACTTQPEPLPPGTDTPRPPATITSTITRSPTLTPGSTATPFKRYPTPRLTPATPIPPPLTELDLPDEMRTLLLVGVDRDAPFVGRTDAVYLVFYHPRLARASLWAIPPDLFVYIPGYTMQRLNIAYAVGGIDLLLTTIQYNFGVLPDSWLVVHLNTFSSLVNDLHGLDVTFLKPVPEICDGFSTGTYRLNGDQVLCYFRYRSGADETSRSKRQQEILRLVFLRFVENGGLVRLPEFYQKYRKTLDTNVTLAQAVAAFPLFVRLGDPSRIAYYQTSPNELETWEITDRPLTRVFLPLRSELQNLIQESVNFIRTPAPYSDVVLTLAAQLTISPTPTRTAIYTATRTITLTRFPTFTPPRPSITPTATITPTPDLSASPTITGTLPTFTPTVTGTPPTLTPTVTGTQSTPTLTPSPTLTLTAAP